MDTSFARLWLRLEGAAALAVAALLYGRWELPWTWFALLFLAPDLAMLGYFAGPRIGAACYNLAHSYALAALPLGLDLLLAPQAGPHTTYAAAGLIWCAHIGFDRALGYGLKSAEGFRFTHLGKIGRDR